MKIGVIGDPHFRENLAYADYFPDRRKGEFQAVLDETVKFLEDCEMIVFLGDNFDLRSNPSSVLRDFTKFVERFNGKKIRILAGNHEKSADGSSAIDFLREIKNPNWKVITKEIVRENGLVFCPYFFRQELGAATYHEATAKIVAQLERGDYLFVHHAISDTQTVSGTNTNLFEEIVLPKAELENRYRLLVGGHVHRPGMYGKTLVAGSLFTSEAGDRNKKVWKIDTNHVKPESHYLPTRAIIKLDNPSVEAVNNALTLGTNFIFKAFFTEKQKPEDMDAIRTLGKKFDAFILQEQYPRERKKRLADDSNLMEATLDKLIRMYAVQRKMEPDVLIAAWEKIK